MTDTNDLTVRPAELAAYLAARMCHDFISPASAISSGLDLLEDPSAQDMREEAMGLIVSSAKKLADLLSFCRVAFGASASAETFDVRDLDKLARGVFNHMRAELQWDVDAPAVNKPAARTLLNLAQMAGAALPIGGIAKVRAVQEGASLAIAIESTGPRARLRPEVLAGLLGQPLGEGLHGHWVQAYYTHLFVTDAGGRVFADVQEERVVFAATLPA
ncbi:MAG: histidine phosphotransferase [Alphaproteobacteria bacterium]|nr:histidine phosphotransferase [Alphaproteobacteria bacterium]MBU1517264.1 histidine phosphotransferase [Alphaproteobacteria bacterium]MBU2093200.1 histidine phosphotransferase [Alphaproteobacteria bacterium]MBU2154229.1 histidine phosphotransferase [Alphaproteobacteria bacterium]MBU2305860.1 histidine phosphotransferase [Alphaproteobacteria bacterium]